MSSRVTTLRGAEGLGEWDESRSGRILQTIRQDMEIKARLFRTRRRNEDILALAYQDSTDIGGGAEWKLMRENALNLPYRLTRWIEAQAISKKMIVKVNRDAGAGQRPGGAGDDATGMWQGITLSRVAYAGGFKREIKALIAEVMPRGTSVMRIGYHEQEISEETGHEVGKNAQSVVVDALGGGETDAVAGQDHAAVAQGLEQIAGDERFQLATGQAGVDAVMARKDSHDEAALRQELDETPRESVRDIRRKVWIRQLRVGEDVGWAPWVYDTEDTPLWWERHVWTRGEVRASDLFTPEFKAHVEGYDCRTASDVHQGGKTPNEEGMGSDARNAQDVSALDDDERLVEWFSVWFRRPDMRSGGIRKIVAPEMPDRFVEADESNPHVDEDGDCLIPGFYPFYDFTPILSSINVPERTCGIPPIAVGMPQFEKLCEYGRLRQEAALKGATRISQIHPGLKDAKKILRAINNGEVGYAFIAPQSMIDPRTGQMFKAVETFDFSSRNPEIEIQAAREESDFVKVTGMPPAVLQGMGTAETASQDQMGLAAGERESGALISYFESRMADVLAGVRGLIRGNYDDEDFVSLLGAEGAQVMKAWQAGSVDDGDEIEVTFGAGAQAQETVRIKQLMEAIALMKAEVDPVTGLSRYDYSPLVEELHRYFDLGKPKEDPGPIAQLQQMVLVMAGQLEQLTGVNPITGEGSPRGDGSGGEGQGGPNQAEGDGPTQGNLEAGARRGTVSAISGAYAP